MTTEATIEVSRALTSAATLAWTEHPLVDRYPEYRALSDTEFAEMATALGADAALEYFKAREKRIADSVRDPFNHEFPLPHWADLEAAVLRSIVTFVPGGNNPGKSRWAASFVMRVLTRRVGWPDIAPDNRIKVLMIAQDDDASRMFQQSKIYEMLPAAWRVTNESGKKPPGFARCINYSEKNGFTEGNLVLPKPLRGQLWFKTVAQYIREPQSFEGPDYDLIVIDEGCPAPLLKSLRGRVAKRGGRIVYLLTCVNGYDQAMGQGLEGAKLVKTLPMNWDFVRGSVNEDIVYPELRMGEHQTELLKRIGCPAGHMPYLMQPLDVNHRIVFMWNVWNPFQPRGKWRPQRGPANAAEAAENSSSRYWGGPSGTLPAMMDACVGDPKWRVLVKMFGWIEKLGQLALGNFNPSVHVLRDEKREALDAMIREGKACVYMADDPESVWRSSWVALCAREMVVRAS